MASPTNGPSDITEQVDKRNVYARNDQKSAGIANVFVDDDSVCRSDADSQLLIYVPFLQPVRLQGIVFDGPREELPSLVKLYANRSAMGFDDVEGAEATQEVALSGEAAGAVTKLKPAKFASVHSLFIFADRPGDATCAISKLRFVGATLQATNMKELKKTGHED